MFGLGDYGSSDEEDASDKNNSSKPEPSQPPPTNTAPNGRQVATSQQSGSTEVEPAAPEPSQEDSNGPMVGPAIPQETTTSMTDEHEKPMSPYSTERSLIRDLTLPPVANLDIPPSPPGSPNPAVNAKFAHFLSLKSQGVHFNEKLASSSSLKNPSLLVKLMEHAGIDEQAQYANSLPADLSGDALPAWGYKEELYKSQQEARRQEEERKAATQRDNIDFVTGGKLAAESNRSGTQGGQTKVSAAERIMSGLSREKVNSPRNSSLARRGESGFRKNRSRSPTGSRRRSRSR